MITVAPIDNDLIAYLYQNSHHVYDLCEVKPSGKWLCTLPKLKIGVCNPVLADDLRALARGFDIRARRLVRNPDKPKAGKRPRLGVSYVFRPPYSWSVYWAFSDATMRLEMQSAFNRAVERSVREYIEPEIARSPLRDGAEISAKILAAQYNLATNRRGYMDYRAHVLIPNRGICADGKTRTLVLEHFHEHKLDAGAYFCLALEHECRRLGIQFHKSPDAIKGEKAHLEVKGVPEPICRYFFHRGRQIEDAIPPKVLASAAASGFATLRTRLGNRWLPEGASLFAAWRDEAARHGLSLDWLTTPLREAPPIGHSLTYLLALKNALHRCNHQASHFERKDIFREIFFSAQGRRGVDPLYMYTYLDRDLRNSSTFINLGIRNCVQRFTTPKILRTEGEMLRDVARLRAAEFIPIPDKVVDRSVDREPRENPKAVTSLPGKACRPILGKENNATLDQQQLACVRYATQTPGRLKAIYGPGGSRQTTVLAAVVDAYRDAGWTVHGTALSGVATQKLTQGAGIPSDTLEVTLTRLPPTTSEIAKHRSGQFYRAARHEAPDNLDGMKLGARSVLFVDEAQMIATEPLARITKACAETGATMVLIGDARQLPTIEHGGAFGSILGEFGGFELTTLADRERQEAKECVKQGSRQEAESVIKYHAKAGNVHVALSHADAQKRLIEDWVKNGGVSAPASHAIFACTALEVRALNELAQQQCSRQCSWLEFYFVKVGDETFYTRDRVLFTKDSRRLDVKSGDIGTILSVQNNPLRAAMIVRLDGESISREIPLRTLGRIEYNGVRRGYATTTDKMRASSADHTYFLLSGSITDRELTHIRPSGPQGSTHIYTDENHSGLALTKLVRQSESERKKLTANSELSKEHSPLISGGSESNAKVPATAQKRTSRLTITLKQEE